LLYATKAKWFPGVDGVRIDYLADHPEVLGDIAAGFKSQWAHHFAGQPLEAIKVGFAACCREEGLPLALVCMDENTFLGTATLRGESGTMMPDVGPWLTHLYVPPVARGRGVGTRLIRAIEAEALRHGFSQVYAVTAQAAALFQRLGWSVLQQVEYQGDPVTVLRRDLASDTGPN
jgi:GNAT superfamily N-acetyltransferase